MAKSKWPRHGLPLPIITEPFGPVPGAMAHTVVSGADRHRLGAADPTYPGLADKIPGLRHPLGFGRVSAGPGPVGQLSRVGTQFKPNPY